MAPIIERNREQIVALCKRYGITRLDVFGSAARGTDFDEATSDADFFYDTERSDQPEWWFDRLMDFAFHLEELLGRRVDLVDLPRMQHRKPQFVERTGPDRRVLYAA